MRGRRPERDRHWRFVRGPRREPYPVNEHPTDGEVRIEAGASTERKKVSLTIPTMQNKLHQRRVSLEAQRMRS